MTATEAPILIELSSNYQSLKTQQNLTMGDPLDLELSCILSREARYTILIDLWGHAFKLKEYINNESQFSPYFTYYEHECQQTTVGGGLPFSKHRQVLDAIVTISTARSQPYNELLELLGTKFLAFKEASRSDQNLGVTLCLRLWLMINVRDPTVDGNIVPGVRTIDWNEKPVMSFVYETLGGNKLPPRGSSTSCLSHDFNARNLDRLAGISIWFTANLVDHLIYDPDTNRLQIYHYNSFLTAHLVNRSSVCLSVFDETFLRETQQTLNLIFPCHDVDATAYLHRLKKVNNTDVDPTLRNVAPMPYTFHPSEFQFYGARLEALKDALNSARHASTKQLWFDRRNRHAWCALWVAVVIFVLTVIFGVISSVTSIMQVSIALKGAQAGRRQGI